MMRELLTRLPNVEQAGDAVWLESNFISARSTSPSFLGGFFAFTASFLATACLIGVSVDVGGALVGKERR